MTPIALHFDPERPVGILLAGGRGARLGDGDKALVPLAGRPLVAHAAARLRPQCAALVLSANGDPARFAGLEMPVVADETRDLGPLAGLLAALDTIRRDYPRATHAVSLPADTPFAPADLVTRFREALRTGAATIAVASSGGRPHHAVALWPVAIRTVLRTAFFDEGERSVGRFAARHAVTFVEWPASPFDPFFNVNTRDDLVRAEAIAAAEPALGKGQV